MLFETLFARTTFLLANYIENETNFIVGPVAAFLGFILNFLFEIVRVITLQNSMGIAIILLTIVARTLMLPLAFKQQKSMVSMRRIQPEMDKIKEKYAGVTDPELKRKMSAEMQALYTKNKVNPFSGCLPLLITLPIFFALSYLMRQSYLYVHELGDIYNNMANVLMGPLNNKAEFPQLMETFASIVNPKIQANSGILIDTNVIADLAKAMNKFNAADWKTLLDQLKNIPGSAYQNISELLATKMHIENFMGIDLVEVAGWGLPGIVIPILTGATTFLSTWVINKQQYAGSKDSAIRTQQTLMLTVMPITMAWMTTGFSSGVGLYWIVSSAYQTVQQILLNKYYLARTPEVVSVIDGKEVKQPKPIITIDKSKRKNKGAK